MHEKIPLVLDSPRTPIRARFEVLFSSGKKEGTTYWYYDCSSYHKLVDFLFKKPLISFDFCYPRSISVLGFFYYDEYFPLDEIGIAPLPVDVFFNSIR